MYQQFKWAHKFKLLGAVATSQKSSRKPSGKRKLVWMVRKQRSQETTKAQVFHELDAPGTLVSLLKKSTFHIINDQKKQPLNKISTFKLN